MKLNGAKIPIYLKLTILVVGLLAFFSILYIARTVLIPLVFSVIIAITLSPLVNFLVRIKINRIVAIFLVLIFSFGCLISICGLLYVQAMRFSESWPELIQKLSEMLNNTVQWASGFFNINEQSIYLWITETKEKFINNSSKEIGNTIYTIGSSVVMIFLIPVYIFLILYYQPLILNFIFQLFGPEHQSKVSQIIRQSKVLVQKYLVGLFIEFVIIALLYTLTLLLLGIEYAILLGIIGALLNLIPYIGGIVGVGLPMIVALVTKSTAWYAVYIMVIYYIIQLIDNNYIVPKIVASKVKLNALISIVAIIVGNALWGIPGMFLSIPLLAIVKLVFDKIEPLKPWGFLLGDTMPPIIKLKPIIFKKLIKR